MSPSPSSDLCARKNNAEENVANAMSLQEAFMKFRRQRKKEINAARKVTKNKPHRTIDHENTLREMFLVQVKKYIGVPYAKKYHEKGTPEYDAPLFLDCCALVRRALKDLKKDFGFTVGAGNQAYQFDTLPISLTKEEMKPGDLVFISGTYFDENRRKQRHNMVHVEVWLGDGDKTVGARWHRGRVQVHDSYQFVSKSYYNMEYHFKSIKTWLQGTCRSFCPEHPWKKPGAINHSRKSLFLSSQQQLQQGQSDSTESSASRIRRLEGTARRPRSKAKRRRTKSTKNRLNSQDDSESKETIVGTTIQDNHSPFNDDDITLYQTCSDEDIDKSSVAKILSSKSNDVQQGNRSLVDSYATIECMCIGNCLCSCRGCQETDIEYSNCRNSGGFVVKEDSCSYETGSFSSSEELLNEIDRELQNSLLLSEESCWPLPMEGPLPAKQCPDHQCGHKGGTVSNGSNKRHKSDQSRQSRGQATNPSPQANTPQVTLRQRPDVRRAVEKTFYIGGHNGTSQVEAALLKMEWRRITDPQDKSYYLKWVECKSQINYHAFQEGQQMVNHIPNGGILTSKAGLLCSLEEYERVLRRINSNQPGQQLCLREFYPETYRIGGVSELKKFQEICKDGEIWICKPSGMNQGKGIFLINSFNGLAERLSGLQRKHTKKRSERIIQRYIANPLLLNGHKFDIRAYMLIASTTPYMVYYHNGYIRLSCVPFSVESVDIHAHLTNQYIQKKHPSYQEKKEETVWSFSRFNDYINDNYMEEKKLPKDWAESCLTYRMKEIMLTCFKSAQNKLERRLGYFDLLGFDFMIDENMKIWLIEINVNPALHTNCQALRDLLPGLIDETLNMCVELFEKKKSKRRLRPLGSLKKFEILYDGVAESSFKQFRKVRSRSRIEERLDETKEETSDSTAIASKSQSLPYLGTSSVTQTDDLSQRVELLAVGGETSTVDCSLADITA